MPELPEVETVRRGLDPYVAGARIDKVTLKRKDLRFPFPDGVQGRPRRPDHHQHGAAGKIPAVSPRAQARPGSAIWA